MNFKTDPQRELVYANATGVFIRATGSGGTFDTYDMAQLDRDSFIEFTRSRGEVSTWALHLILIVLGYDREGVE